MDTGEDSGVEKEAAGVKTKRVVKSQIACS